MKRLLTALAIFALLWVAWRAWGQALTIDEADSYRYHAAQKALGFPGANNHVLNTLLMRISTKLFGVSQFTLRLPALLGAIVYIWAVVRLCRLLSVEWFVQVLLFLCMVFNPLVGDFLAAARGYGMALGFLMLGIVYAAERLFIPVRAQTSWLTCGVAAACFGMSFAANFSFAFVDAAAMTLVFLGAWRSEGWGIRSFVWLDLLASAAPAAAGTWLLTRASVLGFPREQLWYGVKSLRDTISTVAEASVFQPAFGILESIEPFVLPFALLASVAWAAGVWTMRSARRLDWRLRFAASLAGIATTALAVHWALYRWDGLLLPRDRTAIYLPALLTAAGGCILAIPGASRLAKVLRGVQVTAFVVLASYYLSCFRTDYFKEWSWDRETDRTYAILACLNHDYGVRDVTSIWMYISALKVYQTGSHGHEDFRSIVDWRDERLSDTPVYVVNRAFDQNIVAEKKLRLIYEGPSEVAIGVTAELAGRLRPGACLEAAGVKLP